MLSQVRLHLDAMARMPDVVSQTYSLVTHTRINFRSAHGSITHVSARQPQPLTYSDLLRQQRDEHWRRYGARDVLDRAIDHASHKFEFRLSSVRS
jgi:hypothetical protein